MKSNFICCFLLLTSFIGVTSEKRLVYRDSYVILFENVIADNSEKDVSLYINGAKQPSLIVIFRFGNGAITAEWRMDNYTKIFIDANRNIRIANIDKSYEGKYYIQSSGRREVELTISDNLTDEVEKIAKSLNDKQEVILKSLGNVTDKIEKNTKRLEDDHFGSRALTFAILVIVLVSLGASLPVYIPVVWKMLKTGCFRCTKFDNDPTSSVAVDSKTRKDVKTSKKNGIHQTEVNYHQVPTKQPADCAPKKSKGTDLLLARVDDTDSKVMNISGGTDPDLPGAIDPHSPRLPPPDMNIAGGTDPHLLKFADPHLSKLPPADMNISGKPDPHLLLLLAAHKNNSENEDDFLPTAQGRKKIDIRKT